MELQDKTKRKLPGEIAEIFWKEFQKKPLGKPKSRSGGMPRDYIDTFLEIS